jgi:poly(3-hydroxybutyrate) depolymerase
MKRSFLFLVTIILAVLHFSCQKSADETITPLFVKGKNRFTITVDGAEREYYVHVPNNYTGTSATPVVIMFHGTNQSGEQFYNISGWKEVGDSANILTVFPTAWKYCITDDGVTDNMTKWTEYPGGFTYCPGNIPKDDIKFMRQMITALKATFNVDAKKIYCAGFSNGSGFSARCAVELSDIFAATVSSGGGSPLPADTTCNPVRLLPTLLMFGNKDGKLLKNLGLPANGAVPMGFIQLYAAYPGLYSHQPKPFINSFRLNPVPVISGDTNSVAIADYTGISGNPNNVFKMLEIKGMIHEYPNGINHPFKGAAYNWAWFKQFSLP